MPSVLGRMHSRSMWGWGCNGGQRAAPPTRAERDVGHAAGEPEPAKLLQGRRVCLVGGCRALDLGVRAVLLRACLAARADRMRARARVRIAVRPARSREMAQGVSGSQTRRSAAAGSAAARSAGLNGMAGHPLARVPLPARLGSGVAAGVSEARRHGGGAERRIGCLLRRWVGRAGQRADCCRCRLHLHVEGHGSRW